MGTGAVLFVVLMVIAWTTGNDDVGLAPTFRLQLTAAAFVLGGGLMLWATKYRKEAQAEAELREMVRRNLGR